MKITFLDGSIKEFNPELGMEILVSQVVYEEGCVYEN